MMLSFLSQTQRSVHMDKSDVLCAQHHLGKTLDRTIRSSGDNQPQVELLILGSTFKALWTAQRSSLIFNVSWISQHRREVCFKLQTLWDVWKRPSQSGRLHPGQKVRAGAHQLSHKSNWWSGLSTDCCGWTSKKKRSVLYGKWTECMYSVDPKLYETYKKSEKKTSSDSKKLKQVRQASGDVLPWFVEMKCHLQIIFSTFHMWLKQYLFLSQ